MAMRYTKIGKTAMKVSQIGLGTWQIGTKGRGYGKYFDKNDSIKIIQHAIDSGITLIDTAEAYGRGKSESIIGEAIQGYERENIVLISKFLPTAIRPSAVIRALKKSLKRLRTTYLDVYLLHWPNPLLPLRSTLQHMENLIDEGLIRSIGISNYGLKRFISAQEKTQNHRIEVNQVNFSMAKPKIKDTFLPFAKEQEITIMAYSPLAQGFLTGTYSQNKFPKGTRRTNRLFTKSNFKRAKPLFEIIENISDKYAMSMAQVALNWLIQDQEVIAIPGATSISQLEKNIATTDFNITKEDLSLLDEQVNKFKPRWFF
jgi:aryl-alcohol dehydrogenase-like predicted oxidoreductase